MKYFLLIFSFIILTLSIAGRWGNPSISMLNDSASPYTNVFENSSPRARFALIYSILENRSLVFSLPLAKFSLPDLAVHDGNYVSLFAPGTSFLALPGYVIGKTLGASQLGTYSIVSIFAILNVFLIYLFLRNLEVSPLASALAGLIFLFGSPAFAYSVTLYQHHFSTFLLLAALLLVQRKTNFLSLSVVWFLSSLSILIDYPNLFLMAPVALFALTRLIDVSHLKSRLKISLRPWHLLTFVAVIPPLLAFLWYNNSANGGLFRLSGSLRRVEAIDLSGQPTTPRLLEQGQIENFIQSNPDKKNTVNFFRTRRLLGGFYTHFMSLDRGLIFFSPVLVLSIIGVGILNQKRNQLLNVLLGVLGANVIIYSLWGDPWGGWAFGSRYLIPSYSILAIFLGIGLGHFHRRLLVILPFLVLSVYSIAVNTLGAITTTNNPPQVEVLALEKVTGREEKYTWERNWDFLITNGSKSFVFQTYAKNYLTAPQYFYIISWAIVSAVILLTYRLYSYDSP
ncbi:MAG: Uncharacterized protein G01um101416_195 [Microgenomates group bacterium Gr01-1014_16]|nr:MAG: Uncharacterized protein G01um101416_195 [Microgenomates group bacterium Gr01-1014_16]